MSNISKYQEQLTEILDTILETANKVAGLRSADAGHMEVIRSLLQAYDKLNCENNN